MKKVAGGFIALILLLVLVFLGTKSYFFSIGYKQPVFEDERGNRYISRVKDKTFQILDAQGEWQDSFLAGVNIGLGIPGAFPGEYAISYETYFEWFTQIARSGSNTIRVYTPQTPGFYQALYEFNRLAATPLYLLQGVYMDESDVRRYSDVFAPGSIAIRDMRQDIIDCVNMLHGNAVISKKTGKASGIYRYDVSDYVIGWILGIECEAHLVEETNLAHPEMTSFEGEYVYAKNVSPFEVFIAQMKELTIAYETEHYRMQRPVAFSNWTTTDPLKHPNEPFLNEDSAEINVEEIKATSSFMPGFFASYHVYPYYAKFLNYPSGDPQTDANPYLAYLKRLVGYHHMPVIISEFGLPTSRGVTHINYLTGLNQGGHSEQSQGEGLISLLDDIHASGCMGGIVFSWQDEWFKRSWNTMDFDDPDARPLWHNVQSSEVNFGLTAFKAFPSIQIDGQGDDWKGAAALGEGLLAHWDESYLYLRVEGEDILRQKLLIPIDTIAGQGSGFTAGARFERAADFLLGLSVLLALYLFFILVAVNIRLNIIAAKRQREWDHLRGIMWLTREEIDSRLHQSFLCSPSGLDLLSQFLTKECSWESGAPLIQALRHGRYEQCMLKLMKTRDVQMTTLVIRVAGQLRLKHYEYYILEKMAAHKDNPELLYAGLLSLSLMGRRSSLLHLCEQPDYTKNLSFRSLKEIFAVYSGDKTGLFKDLLGSSDPYVRRIAIKNIGDEGLMDLADALLPMMDTEDVNLLNDLIRTFGQLRFTTAGQRISDFMLNPNWTIRNAAVMALAAIDARKYLPSLIQGLKDKEWWVRYNSAKELKSYIKYLRFSDYRRYINSSNMIPVSLMVPAYNEEATILETIKNLLKLDYPEYEVIVINDGSKDNTLKLLLEYYRMTPIEQPYKKSVPNKPVRQVYRTAMHDNLIVVDKENGGKADALNAGINFSRYPVVVSMDADSVLEKDALIRILIPFLKDSTVVAVGGVVRISSGCVIKDGDIIEINLPKSILGKLQTVEYLRSFFTGRIGAAAMDMLLIISGAFGAFRKEVLIRVGGYTTDCIGEDMEVVVKVHREMRKEGKPYKISFLPDPICWTQPPDNLRDIYKQRKRWQIGLINVLLRHRDMAFNPKYGKTGMIMLPYYWIFEFIGPVFETLGYLVIPLSWWLGIVNWTFMALFFLLVVVVGLILSLGAIMQESFAMRKFPKVSHVLTLTAYAVLDNFGFRQFNTVIRFIGFIKYRKGKDSWGAMKRKKFTGN